MWYVENILWKHKNIYLVIFLISKSVYLCPYYLFNSKIIDTGQDWNPQPFYFQTALQSGQARA